MRSRPSKRRQPPLPALVAGGLVVLGVALAMFAHPSLLLVAALGAFGPGILRELGWLGDHDEFQRGAARRAGYHAYLVGGVMAAGLYSVVQWFPDAPVTVSELVVIILIALWMTWLFSAVIGYWGAPRTASTVLVVFGSFWTVFSVASFMDGFSPDLGIGLILMLTGGILALASAFFVPAWTAHRWPRATGAALIVFAVALTVFFFTTRRPDEQWATRLLVGLLLLGPVIISAVGLLGTGSLVDPEETDETVLAGGIG